MSRRRRRHRRFGFVAVWYVSMVACAARRSSAKNRLSLTTADGPISRARVAALEAAAAAARAFLRVGASWARVGARRAIRTNLVVRLGWLTALAVSLSAMRGWRLASRNASFVSFRRKTSSSPAVVATRRGRETVTS